MSPALATARRAKRLTNWRQKRDYCNETDKLAVLFTTGTLVCGSTKGNQWIHTLNAIVELIWLDSNGSSWVVMSFVDHAPAFILKPNCN